MAQRHPAERDEWLAAQFADPINGNFRLLPESPQRGKGLNGADPGPQPFREEVFFFSPAGDDTTPGLSPLKPWNLRLENVRVSNADEGFSAHEVVQMDGDGAEMTWNGSFDGAGEQLDAALGERLPGRAPGEGVQKCAVSSAQRVVLARLLMIRGLIRRDGPLPSRSSLNPHL